MDEEFLREYIENEMYLQNPPLKMSKFLKLCKKYDIQLSIKELQSYEKLGLFKPIFRIKYVKNQFFNDFDYFNFRKKEKEDLLKALSDNLIFVPNEDNFIEYDKFKTKDCEIINYYSNFQIEWIFSIHNSFKYSLNILLDEHLELFEGNKERCIKSQLNAYTANNKKLSFLLSLSRLYYPRSQHDFNIFKLNSDDKSWDDDREKFSAVEILENLIKELRGIP